MLRFLAALSFVGLLAGACAPSARSLPCENDAQCAKASSQFRYCAESKCVECVGSPDCGDKAICVAGTCAPKCKSQSDCGEDEKCDDGVCRKSGG